MRHAFSIYFFRSSTGSALPRWHCFHQRQPFVLIDPKGRTDAHGSHANVATWRRRRGRCRVRSPFIFITTLRGQLISTPLLPLSASCRPPRTVFLATYFPHKTFFISALLQGTSLFRTLMLLNYIISKAISRLDCVQFLGGQHAYSRFYGIQMGCRKIYWKGVIDSFLEKLISLAASINLVYFI